MGSQEKRVSENYNGLATPIAIVGMAGIFPEAENLTRYWTNIFQEVNCITEVPASRWSIEDYYDKDPLTPDKTYSKHGGFIPDTPFDPLEFGLPPNFLEVTDVSQLLGLVVAKDALTDAGYPNKGKEIYDRTGVILGMVGMSSKVIQPLLNRLQYPVWEKVLRSSSVPVDEIPRIIEKIKLAYIGWNENAFPGAIGNVVAGRIANRFDFRGTNCIVDAACGSSLAAVGMAVNELALKHADMMITGGVDTDNSILTYLCFSKTPAFSKSDRLRAFSEDSDGMLTGEGIGMMVLKRLEDAERDEDRIYAVIRGVGTSSDGYFKSIYAPRPSGQSKAIQRAYDQAGFSPKTVGLIEAHGTGTNAGDPAEFEGLREVFSQDNPQKQHIALGSVKSQIGHTKATAGAASLIKASLALYHKVLPATINVSKPNPSIEIEQSPFYLNTHTRPWLRRTDGEPRRAGVSSFGFGGTNFHIAIEEYKNGKQGFLRLHPSPYTILLSALTQKELQNTCLSIAEKLAGNMAEETLNHLDESSSSTDIPSDHMRVGFVAVSIADAREKLADVLKLLESNKDQENWTHPKGILFRSNSIETNGKTVALFPGQGSQYVNMGLELAINYSSFREVFEHADTQVVENGGKKLSDVVYPIPVFSDEERKVQQEKITATENAQPAIGAFSMGLYQALESAGFQADYYAGHSFGELSALWASGMLDDEAYLRLAVARGQAMSSSDESGNDTGSMAAVKGNIDQIITLIKDYPEVKIANFNSPSQVVLAGSTQGIQDIQRVLKDAGMSVYVLNVSAAFHTKFVEHAKKPFSEAIMKEKFHKAKGKVYSNTTAQPYLDDVDASSQTLSDHILNPVRFQEEIENIYKDGGRIFIEIGPKNVLSSLVKDILGDQPHEIITFNPNTKGDSDIQFRQAVLQLRVLGFALGNIDPLKSHESAETATVSKVSVMLNGGLFTTDATRQKFEQALKEGSSARNTNLQTEASKPVENNEKIISTTDNQPTQLVHPPNTILAERMTNNNEIENLIETMQTHQSELMKVHEQFLQNDIGSKNILQQIAGTELFILSGSNGSKPDSHTLNAIQKQAEHITSQHAATSSAHLAYIQAQTDFMRQFTELVQGVINDNKMVKTAIRAVDQEDFRQIQTESNLGMDALPLNGTIATTDSVVASEVQASSSKAVSELNTVFLAIVSEKTGYPVDMLEPGMDMEADLGIDSIKRVEILGAMQEQHPELPTIAAEELVELRTLAQVIGAFAAESTTHASLTPENLSTVIKHPTALPPAAENIEKGEVQKSFLEIVSEKTGYPVDMLDLSMDMEADLGIDSIKRVEILGAVQEKFPDLHTIDAENLVELRTLAQVIGGFQGENTIKAYPQPIVVTHEQLSDNSMGVRENSALDNEIKASFLEIVSEKTGYPTDMLALDMDMEADLGIDSIKRVEILGAVQEKYPELPTIGTEDLVEMRTLGQIISQFSRGEKKITEHPPVVVESQRQSSPRIMVLPVVTKLLSRPDSVAIEFPEGGTVLITSDDADKANHLAKSIISENGLKVGLIHLSPDKKSTESNQSHSLTHYFLEAANESSVEALMRQVIADHETIVAFIHLESAHHSNNIDLIDISDDGERSLKSVFLIARYLKAPLIHSAAETRSVFFTVTQMDGQFGLNGYKATDPLPGGFAGLVKSLRQEWPNVFCRALDFHPEMKVDEITDKIQDELHDPDLRLSEVGYTHEGRYTLMLSEER